MRRQDRVDFGPQVLEPRPTTLYLSITMRFLWKDLNLQDLMQAPRILGTLQAFSAIVIEKQHSKQYVLYFPLQGNITSDTYSKSMIHFLLLAHNYYYGYFIIIIIRYHDRAALVISSLQLQFRQTLNCNEIASHLQLKMKDGDTDTIASMLGETKSIGIHSPFKTNR